jgi:hypothetical protein
VQNSVYSPEKPDWQSDNTTTENIWLNKEEEMPNVNDLKQYLCATDVKDGDILRFKDAGEFIDKDFSKEQDGSDIKTVLEITVELPSGKTKKYSPNAKTRDSLAEGYGSPDTEKWIGKEASVVLVKQSVFGQIKNIIYLEPIK